MDPSSKKIPVMEFDVAKVLTTYAFFLGATTVIVFERLYWRISTKERYQIPDDWPYKEARQLFKEPLVLTEEEQLDLKWIAQDEDGLITFLVNENGFNADRVTKAIEKIKAAKNKSSRCREVLSTSNYSHTKNCFQG
ncbi:hypothetical protein K1719_031457 [Acacia pycnantha]|nr:hypothetical protein K1719_031457 [Acacia pycnantha]